VAEFGRFRPRVEFDEPATMRGVWVWPGVAHGDQIRSSPLDPKCLTSVRSYVETDFRARETGRSTWPSFWDGEFNGPIQIRYIVDHYPTLYVLDPRGVIRYIDVRAKGLDRAVDALLLELEDGSKRDSDPRPES
jgi:hypothetical protein